jgi:hypothetical protein
MRSRKRFLVPFLAILAACGGGDGGEVREEGAGYGEADPADSVVVGTTPQEIPGADEPGPQPEP